MCARAQAGSAVGVGGGRRDGVCGAGRGVRPRAGRLGGRCRRGTTGRRMRCGPRCAPERRQGRRST
ncbi:hypothetical protein C6T59_23060 [Burkholderia multivorans]|nr:hypothetical protein C6Q23_10415 [Burkholderia multivorans]PRG62057.1 hypothetical protein C6T59_23060 [Burkholderia multivorans]